MKQDIFNYLIENMGFDDDSLQELFDSFLEMLDDQLSQIGPAEASADFETLRRVGHTIKGSSANIGAEPMRVAGLKLQDAGTAHDLEGCRAAAAEIVALVDALKAE